ncbi:MAG: beta-ketoacyl-ACP synthase II [Dehalococcoidia bacterium]|nr:beta-ketoacyl-ACP synthase II [Dehalococcoidia bacterium]
MNRPRVVVTGVGAVTPAGNTAEETWASVLDGRSGVGPITLFDAEPFPVRIQAEVKDFEIDERIGAKQRRHMNRGVRFAMNSVLEALDDSGLEITEENCEDVGIIFGNGGGGYEEIWEGDQALQTRGPRRVSPFLIANFIVDAASGHISIHTGARGPNVAVVSACATGAAAIGAGAHAIQRGDAAAVIAGSCESVLVPVFHATWCSMRALASDNENPEQAVKPFDLNRDGFAAGEGAGAVILEEYEHARARGARIYCELLGSGTSNDAYDMIALDEAGRGLRRSITGALREADIDAAEIDYINPHGSGTKLNDRIETVVVKELMGEAAYEVSMSSIKPVTGHGMAAAGSIEAIACILAIRDQKVPPTINYTTPDPECDLDYVPNVAKSRPVRTALSTSVGLGGHNAAVIFRAVNGAV